MKASMRYRFAMLVVGALLTASIPSFAASLEALTHGTSGRIYAIKVTPPVLATTSQRPTPTAVTLKATADAFVQDNLQLLGIENPSVNLLPAAPETDNLGLSRVHYFQRWQGLDVLGGEITVHLNRDGQVCYVKTKVARDLPSDTTPGISQAAAEKAAIDQALHDTGSQIEPVILKSRLIVLPLGILKNEPSTASYLAWEIEVGDDESRGEQFGEAYYIDARSGLTLFQVSRNLRDTPITRQVKDCARITSPTLCELDISDALYPGYVHGRSEGMPPRGPDPNPSGVSGKPSFYGSTDVDRAYDYLGALHACGGGGHEAQVIVQLDNISNDESYIRAENCPGRLLQHSEASPLLWTVFSLS